MLTPVGQMGYMVESTSKSLIQTAHNLQKVYTLFFGHLLLKKVSEKKEIFISGQHGIIKIARLSDT